MKQCRRKLPKGSTHHLDAPCLCIHSSSEQGITNFAMSLDLKVRCAVGGYASGHRDAPASNAKQNAFQDMSSHQDRLKCYIYIMLKIYTIIPLGTRLRPFPKGLAHIYASVGSTGKFPVVRGGQRRKSCHAQHLIPRKASWQLTSR